MTQIQGTLLLLFVTLATVLLGRIAWGVLAPVATATAAAIPALVSSVPAWVWWTALGVAMSLRYGRGCGQHRCGRSASAPS